MDKKEVDIDDGVDPFPTIEDHLERHDFCLGSILFDLDLLPERKRENKDSYVMHGILVKEVNLNPFVYLPSGKKKYFQRDLCWLLKQKQGLIQSIYQGIDCGKILTRKRGWDELEDMAKHGETELAFRDLIDGKQRLSTISSFYKNEFPDKYGNYYRDLSRKAKLKFNNSTLFSYSSLPERSSDESVLRQFLKLNTEGTPQSPEHLKFVSRLYSMCLRDANKT